MCRNVSEIEMRQPVFQIYDLTGGKRDSGLDVSLKTSD